ncbi:MAG: CotH kinase family protein [Chitinophagaceae bacterium]
MKKIAALLAFVMISCTITAQVFTSSNLPIISINTNGQTIVDEPKIMADMGIIYNGVNVRNNTTDIFNHYNGKIGIEIRGESSQQFPMKSYSIELWDAAGKSVDKSLFGLPKESDWVLYAPYSDKTLMRNFLAYTMSREMGRWAANCRYVELILNGEYKGIYVFMEKIKRGSGRVNISKIATTDNDGDAVTGGYIFAIDKDADAWFSSYQPLNGSQNQRIQFSYTYPKITAITEQQSAYLRRYTDSFETALYNSNSTTNNWRQFADEASFIDYMIINEISRNVDGYRLSAYFYKDRLSKGGKIFAGPVWDYDLAFRNANYCNAVDTSGWAFEFNKTCPTDYWLIPFWWDRLSNDPGFRAKLRCRWKELRQTSLSNDRINQLIDSVYTLTSEARQRHFTKWTTLGTYVWPNPNPIASTYDGEIYYLKEWIEKRITWIDRHIPNEGACYDFPDELKVSAIISGAPNPVTTSYTVTVKSRRIQKVTIRVVNLSGQQIYLQNADINAGINNVSIAAAKWQRGTYIVKIEAETGEQFYRKIVKL